MKPIIDAVVIILFLVASAFLIFSPSLFTLVAFWISLALLSAMVEVEAPDENPEAPDEETEASQESKKRHCGLAFYPFCRRRDD